MGGCAHEGGLPRIGPCIAQRGGTVRSTAFGSLTGVFFGTVPLEDIFSFPFHQFLGYMPEGGEEVSVSFVESKFFKKNQGTAVLLGSEQIYEACECHRSLNELVGIDDE